LEENNYTVLSLLPKQGLNLNFDIFQKIKNKDIVIFSRQFSVMISANVSLVQALRVLVDQTVNQKLKKIINAIANDVDGGARLSEAMSAHPEAFSRFFTSVIRSGETSGKLDEVLEYLAEQMERDYDMISKVKGAMIYPAIILILLAVVGAFSMIFVVPQLTTVLTESGVALPLPTRMLIGISDLFVNFWWLMAALLVAVLVGFRFYGRTDKGRRNLDIIKLRLPIFGPLFRLIYLVRFSRSMHTLIVGGVTISQSLEVAADVVDNEVYRDLILQTLEAVEGGDSISSIFSHSDQIPPMVSQMLVIGEKTGKIDLILSKITDFYSREASAIVANLMVLIEPIVLVVMGVAVATMIVAIIMPMYNMASQF
jgi:type IV pilus assembly protein PilC